LASLRRWFSERGVLEVETPALSARAATDPNIESLTTETGSREYFLHTSPEFPMKRLLASGSGDIFQVCRVFRGSEAGSRHNPEFTMLEWYRLGMDMNGLIDDVESLVRHLCVPAAPLPRARRVSYGALVAEATGLDPFVAGAAEIGAVLDSRGVAVPELPIPDRQCLLDLLFSTVVEPSLDTSELLFVYHFPLGQAALARVCPTDPRVAERFELFLGGMEIANGFHELDDAGEQRERFMADNERRRALGRPELPIDERLVAALDAGLPDCSGVALGIDRLMMHIVGAGHIREVLAFDVEQA
jgi:lysyl-tRNA synthetase class 2